MLEALRKPLPVPVVWNSGGYERVETLRTLEGKVQIYLPDLKYAMERPARELSAAPDYFEAAAAAIDEMVRQVGAYQIGDDGLMRSGVILRHLVLPGQTGEHQACHRLCLDAFSAKDGALFAHEPVYAAERFDRRARAALK